MTKVAVASRSFSRHPQLRAELLQRYPATSFNDQGVALAGEALIAFLEGHEKAIVALERLDEAVLSCLPQLRVVSKYGVGLDKLDLPALAARGIKLGWKGGVNRRSVAELVVGFAIVALRRLREANNLVMGGGWSQLAGRQLSDCTVGIIGCGHVGQDVVKLLAGFGCPVLAHDIRDFPEFYTRYNVTKVDLDTLLERADVVTLHVPLDRSTANLLAGERLSRMKKGAILINTARGGIVDEVALKHMLTSGHLSAAAFDVFASEPPDDRELLALPNLFVTPHIGGSSQEAILAMGRAAIEGLDEAGDPLAFVGS